MNDYKMKFQERIEGGIRRLYAVSFWSKEIRVNTALVSDAFYFDGDALHITCANGSAKYLHIKTDGDVWIGYLSYARGDHPVYSGTGPTQ